MAKLQQVICYYDATQNKPAAYMFNYYRIGKPVPDFKRNYYQPPSMVVELPDKFTAKLELLSGADSYCYWEITDCDITELNFKRVQSRPSLLAQAVLGDLIHGAKMPRLTYKWNRSAGKINIDMVK